MNVLLVSQQLAALLVSGNVSPWLIAGCGAVSLSHCWQGAGLGQSLSSTASLCLLLGPCPDKYVLPSIVYLYEIFWGDSLTAVAVLGWFSMDELSSCSTTFAVDVGFVARFCSWVCVGLGSAVGRNIDAPSVA